MATWYCEWCGDMRAKTFVGETEKYLIDERGRRTKKRTNHESWFPTFDELQKHLIDECERSIKQHSEAIAFEQQRMAKLLAMKAPKPDKPTK